MDDENPKVWFQSESLYNCEISQVLIVLILSHVMTRKEKNNCFHVQVASYGFWSLSFVHSHFSFTARPVHTFIDLCNSPLYVWLKLSKYVLVISLQKNLWFYLTLFEFRFWFYWKGRFTFLKFYFETHANTTLCKWPQPLVFIHQWLVSSAQFY